MATSTQEIIDRGLAARLALGARTRGRIDEEHARRAAWQQSFLGQATPRREVPQGALPLYMRGRAAPIRGPGIGGMAPIRGPGIGGTAPIRGPGTTPLMAEINMLRQRMAQRRQGFVDWWQGEQKRTPIRISPPSPPGPEPIPTASELTAERGEAIRGARGQIQQSMVSRGLFGSSRQRVLEREATEDIGEAADEQQRAARVARYWRGMGLEKARNQRLLASMRQPQQVQLPRRLRGLLD